MPIVRRPHRLLPWLLIAVLVCAAAIHAADYLTEGVDSGRTGWLKEETVFNTTNVRTMKLLWTAKVNSIPRQMHNLFAPLAVTGVATPRGPRELVIFAGISDALYAFDVATGEMLWEKKFDSIYPAIARRARWHVVSRRSDSRPGDCTDADGR